VPSKIRKILRSRSTFSKPVACHTVINTMLYNVDRESGLQAQLEEDGGCTARQSKWSVAYASLGVKRHKSRQFVFQLSGLVPFHSE